MNKVLWYSFLIGTLALVLCLIMIGVSVPLMGEEYQASMFVNGVLGCYGIGMPVAYYCFSQAEKLRIANAELIAIREELEAARAVLIDKVRTDSMTGTLTRDYFIEKIERRQETASFGALLIIDADHFKGINDRFGHMVGDKALVAITDAIKSALRADDIVGRIGGEEFGVFLPETNAEQAMQVSERVRRKVAAIQFVLDGQEERLALTVSVGGVVCNGTMTRAELFAAADRRLYVAKETGRNRVVISGDVRLAA